MKQFKVGDIVAREPKLQYTNGWRYGNQAMKISSITNSGFLLFDTDVLWDSDLFDLVEKQEIPEIQIFSIKGEVETI